MAQESGDARPTTAAKVMQPTPRPDHVTRPFWEACARRVLCFQQCTACGYRWLPPSVVCPRCWGDATAWVESGGHGKVLSFAVYHRAYHPAFEELLPYVVAVVELTEGPRLISNVVDTSPERIHVDMAVCLAFRDAGEAVLPVFRPAETAEEVQKG